MSEVVMELNAEEQELIERNRKEQAEKLERQREADRIRQEKIDAEKQRVATGIERMKTRLLAADPERDVLFEAADGSVHFLIGSQVFEVIIEEHMVSYQHSYRSRSDGFKYKLYGDFNDWKERRYKNANTVIKRIKEFQAGAAARREAKQKQLSLKERAQAHLEDAFPLVDIKHENAYDYSTRSHYNRQPNHFVLKTDKGTVKYTYGEHYETGDLELRIWTVNPTSEVQDEIAMMILTPDNDA